MKKRVGAIMGSMAAALIAGAAVACGTLLDAAPDEVVQADAQVTPHSEAGPMMVGDVTLQLDADSVDLRAGGAEKMITMTITRAAGSKSVVSLVPRFPSGIMSSPNASSSAEKGAEAFAVKANPDAMPGRFAGSILVVVGSAMQSLDVTFYVSAEYRDAPNVTPVLVAEEQTYLVKAWGAGGAGPLGGAGAYVEATLTAPAQTTMLVVPGSTGGPAVAGFPGGGAGGFSSDAGVYGFGGGGYSGIFFGSHTQENAKVVAAGGGGGSPSNAGGGGGATAGAAGTGPLPGLGGTQTNGGAAGNGNGPPSQGDKLTGGQGGTDLTSPPNEGGGGGGGGWFGGGGGEHGSVSGGGGGGGGSSYFPAGSGVAHPAVGPAPGMAGDPDRGTAGAPGQPGAVIIVPKKK